VIAGLEDQGSGIHHRVAAIERRLALVDGGKGPSNVAYLAAGGAGT
jgi:hypothetical protein